MSIFFFLLTVIVWTTSHPTDWISDMINIRSCRSPYTCTFRSLTLADGVWGEIRTESAMAVATQNATVVKSPNTFCARTRVECILAFRQHMYSELQCWSIAHQLTLDAVVVVITDPNTFLIRSLPRQATCRDQLPRNTNHNQSFSSAKMLEDLGLSAEESSNSDVHFFLAILAKKFSKESGNTAYSL